MLAPTTLTEATGERAAARLYELAMDTTIATSTAPVMPALPVSTETVTPLKAFALRTASCLLAGAATVVPSAFKTKALQKLFEKARGLYTNVYLAFSKTA